MSGRPKPRQNRSRRYYSAPRTCTFCTDRSIVLDYKDVGLLKKFVVGEGKIRPRRQTGTCAKHQRKLAQTIKRSRHMALLPFASEIIR